MIYKNIKKCDFKIVSKELLLNKVYSPQGRIKHCLRFAIDNDIDNDYFGTKSLIIKQMVVCYHRKKPIGVCLLDNCFIQIFVRREHRRKGIGTELVKRIGCKIPSHIWIYNVGKVRSKFWTNVGKQISHLRMFY